MKIICWALRSRRMDSRIGRSLQGRSQAVRQSSAESAGMTRWILCWRKESLAQRKTLWSIWWKRVTQSGPSFQKFYQVGPVSELRTNGTRRLPRRKQSSKFCYRTFYMNKKPKKIFKRHQLNKKWLTIYCNIYWKK